MPATEPRQRKIVVLGATAVGKTSLINRFCGNPFDADTRSTVGASFFSRQVQADNTPVSLMFWDTAGEERFRSVAPALLRGANGVILVFDLTQISTFAELDPYLTMFLDTWHADPNRALPVLLLGNKKDLPDRTVAERDVEKWQQTNRVNLYYEVSAKDGTCVEAALLDFVTAMITPEAMGPITAPVQLPGRVPERGCCG
jgi:small GTP-binding protein